MEKCGGYTNYGNYWSSYSGPSVNPGSNPNNGDDTSNGDESGDCD